MRALVFALLATAVFGEVSLASAEPNPAYRVVSKIALPDGGWDLLSFDPVLRHVYVTRSDSVDVIDADTGEMLDGMPPAAHGHATIPIKNGAEILVTDGGSDTAQIFNAKTGAELATIKTGKRPDAALYDEASGLVVVMNPGDGSLTLIDPSTRSAVGSIAIGGSLELGASDGKGRIFVNVEDRNEVAVVDLRSRKLISRVPLTGCEGPTGIAYLTLSKTVLSSCANGVAVVTDTKRLKHIAKLPIGAGPDTVLYDARRRVAFVPAGRSGELDIFSDSAKGVNPAGKIATQLGARTAALDEKTGRIYLPAAEYAPPDKPGGRPQPRPGSVVLVVVQPGE